MLEYKCKNDKCLDFFLNRLFTNYIIFILLKSKTPLNSNIFIFIFNFHNIRN